MHDYLLTHKIPSPEFMLSLNKWELTRSLFFSLPITADLVLTTAFEGGSEKLGSNELCSEPCIMNYASEARI